MPEAEYVQALIQDLKNSTAELDQKELTSIFFGGGTPSLMSAEGIQRILEAVKQQFLLDANTEITLEANPGATEFTKFKGFKAAGVNRISLGVQSFHNDMLKKLGRIHNQREVIQAIDALKEAGFTNFNLDLMFGLPQQSLAMAMEDLAQALSYQPSHLSWYQLTLEPNTLFYKQPPPLPSEDNLYDMQLAGQKRLAQNGFLPYEVSAYTQSRPSKHNMNYWQFGDYLGIGAGAHSKITNPTKQTIIRHHRHRSPKQYLAKGLEHNNFIAGSRPLSQKDLIFEFMLNGLRLNEGIETALFTQRTGLELSTIEPTLKEAINAKLLAINEDRLIPTKHGKRYLNDLIGLFLEDTCND